MKAKQKQMTPEAKCGNEAEKEQKKKLSVAKRSRRSRIEKAEEEAKRLRRSKKRLAEENEARWKERRRRA